MIWDGKWRRDDIAAHPDWLFVFGEIAERENKKSCSSASFRNTVGITVKRGTYSCDHAFFTDDDYHSVLDDNQQATLRLRRKMQSGKYKKLVLPEKCWGTGHAELDTRAPKIFAVVKRLYDELASGVFPPSMLKDKSLRECRRKRRKAGKKSKVTAKR